MTTRASRFEPAILCTGLTDLRGFGDSRTEVNQFRLDPGQAVSMFICYSLYEICPTFLLCTGSSSGHSQTSLLFGSPRRSGVIASEADQQLKG